MHWPSAVADCDKSQTHVKSCIKCHCYHDYLHAHKTFLHMQCSLCEDRVSSELAYCFHMIQRKFNRSKSIACLTWDGCGPGGTLYFKWWGWLNVGKNQNPNESLGFPMKPKNPWTKNQLINKSHAEYC